MRPFAWSFIIIVRNVGVRITFHQQSGNIFVPYFNECDIMSMSMSMCTENSFIGSKSTSSKTSGYCQVERCMSAVSLLCVNISIIINQQFNHIYVTFTKMNKWKREQNQQSWMHEFPPFSVAWWMGMAPSFVFIFTSALLFSKIFATSTASVCEFKIYTIYICNQTTNVLPC